MTTIATDGKTLSSDSQMTGGFIEQMDMVKIFQLEDCIVGIAGGVAEAMVFVDWLKSETKDEKPELGDIFDALVMYKNKVIWYGGRLVPVKVGALNAIGSGADHAMGAMMAGATPKEAVAIAKKLDPHTGGKIRTLELK